MTEADGKRMASRAGTNLRIDDTDIVVEGQGADTILLLHGWPDTHRLWDAQVDALRDRYRCVRFTWPGFAPGAARRAWSLDELVALVGRVADAVSIAAPVTLLLHDWGCLFGYQYALRQPHRVRRIIGVDIGDAGSRQHRSELSLRNKALVVGYQLWLAAAWHLGGQLGDAMARRMARAARAPADPARITAQMGYPYAAQWTGVRGGYGSAKRFVPACPMLFIYGTRKPFMFHSAAWAADVAARAGSRVLPFNTGHWVMVAQPDAFNRAVLDWLGSDDDAAVRGPAGRT